MQNILVTGGCGFIGTNFIRFLLSDADFDGRIINVDKLTYAGNPQNMADIEDVFRGRYFFIMADICDPQTITDLFAKYKIHTICNFADESHVDRSIKDSTEFIRTNVFGTQALLDAAKEHRIKRFIQIGTDEVYGSIRKGRFNEDSPLEPNSPYAASKAAADLLARSYFVTHKLPVIIIRSSNNFGPYQYPEKIIPLFITNALENPPVEPIT